MVGRVAEQWRVALLGLLALASIPLLMASGGTTSTSAVETTTASTQLAQSSAQGSGETASLPADAVTVTSLVNRSEDWVSAREEAVATIDTIPDAGTGARAFESANSATPLSADPSEDADPSEGAGTIVAPTSTTATSTTSPPATSPPTTVTPTTVTPTTVVPTTSPPATSPPTTSAPSTVPPTTATPTTHAPAEQLPPPPAGGDPTAEQWAELRSCESSGRYDAVNPTGQYRGAYQFGQATWDGLAARFFPQLVGLDPAGASVGDQDNMALALWRTRGSQPWPHCGQHLLS